MRWSVLAIGQRMPHWVEAGWNEYERRFPRGFDLQLRELPAVKRSRNADIDMIRTREGESLLAAVPNSDRVIALDENGKQWSTAELADHMRQWMQHGENVSFLVGGPDGLSQPCLDRSDHCWSLSRLTFPHPLVRAVLAEQLYRAWTVTQNHPYHRE